MIQDLAHQAEVLSLSGDSRGSARIVRGLSGCPPQAIKVVELKSGSLSTSERQRQVRWQEHFCELFRGNIAPSVDSLAYPLTAPLSSKYYISYNDTCTCIDTLATHKGVGPDGIAGEILKAGGECG